MLYQRIGLTLISFVLLSGCSLTQGQYPLVFMPIHVEQVSELKDMQFATEKLHYQNAVRTESGALSVKPRSMHQPAHLAMSENEKKLLQDAFVMVISQPTYRIISGEVVEQALKHIADSTEVLDRDIDRTAMISSLAENCHLIVCQRKLASILGAGRVAYAYVGLEGNDYLFSITLINTLDGTYETKSGRCRKCSYVELLHQVREADRSQKWRRGEGYPTYRVPRTRRFVGEREIRVAAVGNMEKILTPEEISLVVNGHKDKIHPIFQRALRRHHFSEGSITFELMVTGKGQVLDLRVASSDLGNVYFENALAKLIKTFEFPSKPIERMIITLPLSFHTTN